MPEPLDLPTSLDHLRQIPEGRAWLADVPRLVAECRERWSLELGDPYPGSYVSVVMPATRADGAPAVLKVQFPHEESEHEADALRVWDGKGAIRLLDHDPDRHALLLEHCIPGTHLRHDPQALDVLIGLLPRLWIPAAEPFTRLEDEAQRWAAGLPDQWERSGRPFERRLLDAAVEALTALAAEPTEPVLLHQDLHADNVLAAEREPWLVIDPKPLRGDRAFSAAPIVRSYELGHSRGAVLHRLDRLTAETGIDRERARLWALGQTLAWAFVGDRPLPRHIETARWLVDA
ncbi:MAG TPA: aminoglycoside phosphotransferase family protein [Acidimicrobiia bacterium]|nr:aminoglycoside phosphotransferase family protein [Acidimicrobiia bacterium]